MSNTEQKTAVGLTPYLSPAAAWALALGTSIGWGSLVVTTNTYLAQAGPLGTICGLVIGAALMIVISRNFAYMAMQYPDAGGVYTYTKTVFGYDRAFLISWFLSLVYISMFWANATSLPLFARYFLGDTFRFGYLYTVFGYEVYIGEVLLTLFAILLVTLLCIRSKQIAAHVMVGLAAVLTLGITVCFAVAMLRGGADVSHLRPGTLPEKSAFSQVLRIVFISPWAFIGFEGITHSAEEFKFRRTKLFRILCLSVVSATLLYIFVTLLSISAYPAEYGSWLEYIRDLGNLGGIRGIPAFYAADHYLGSFGIVLLSLALLALVLTSLIGNLRALSRLFYAVARDDILPAAFAELNSKQIPAKSMMLVAALSVPIVFVGRTAIGWIVDVTTIGATLLYGFVSAAALKMARQDGNRGVQVTGWIGFLVMLVFGVYLLFPNLFSDDTLETETYILFIVWSIIGFFYFRRIIGKDHARRFGKAIIVWIVLLAMVVLMSMIWTSRADEQVTEQAIHAVQDYYNGTAPAEAYTMGEEAFISSQIAMTDRSSVFNTVVVLALFLLALAAMLINHFSMKKWEQQTASERDAARTAAYVDPMTGVKSKTAFAEEEKSLDTMISGGSNDAFGLVVCDVNGLKYINDTFGHQAGDAYIRSGSRLICEVFQHSPVYRVGGDEFLVLLTGRDYEARETLLEQFNSRVVENLREDRVVVSAGMSVFIRNEDNCLHDVFERADALMYERKKTLKSMGAKVR